MACAKSARRSWRPTSAIRSSRISWRGSASSTVGTQLIKSVRPEQQIVKIVHDELVELMGAAEPSIRFEKTGPTILMLCGLQGSGKTTTCGKLARLLASQGRKPLLVAADLQRPAAVEQLKVIGAQLDVPVFSASAATPVKVCQDAVLEANRQGATPSSSTPPAGSTSTTS